MVLKRDTCLRFVYQVVICHTQYTVFPVLKGSLALPTLHPCVNHPILCEALLSFLLCLLVHCDMVVNMSFLCLLLLLIHSLNPGFVLPKYNSSTLPFPQALLSRGPRQRQLVPRLLTNNAITIKMEYFMVKYVWKLCI